MGYGQATAVTTNTSGSVGPVPEEIRRLGWICAFLLTPIWSLCHSSWLGLLAIVPCVGIVFSIMYGLNGNQYAWQSRRFESIEQFKEVQRKWALAGAIVGCLWILLNILQLVVAATQQGPPPGAPF